MIPGSYFRADLSCYGVEFSPFHPGMIALATSQYFGIVGNGRQFILRLGPDGALRPLIAFDTQDALLDCAWSESNENQLVSASGDGSIKLWDINAKDGFPIAAFAAHSQEISSVDWNLVEKRTFLSAGWDATVKHWDPARGSGAPPLGVYAEHAGCVYNAAWCPRSATMFATVSGDRTLKLWDVTAGPRSTSTTHAHNHEILALDWNKYNPNILCTGSVDRTIRSWDVRNLSQPIQCLEGHAYAIRRLRCSPHSESIIASVSYDMTTMLWVRACAAASRYSSSPLFLVLVLVLVLVLSRSTSPLYAPSLQLSPPIRRIGHIDGGPYARTVHAPL